MPDNLPFVTVIIPVRNEADFIERSLGALLAQDYPHDCMEALIADGLSTDATKQIVEQLIVNHPDLSIKVLDNPEKIVSTGLNRALRDAKGEIIIRVDGHCEIAPEYVSRCVEHILTDKVDAVGGPIDTVGGTPISQSIALAMSSAFGVGGSAFRTIKDKTMLVDTIAFPAYTRKAIEAAGPYDEELVRNQDDEYNYRLRSLGFKLLLAADIHSRYYSRSSLGSLWKQYFQYGFYKVRVMQKHRQQMRLRQFVPPLFVASMLGGALLAPFIPLVGALWLVILALYVIANLVVSLRLAARQGWPHLPRLPLIFAILHIAYGFGFLVGLVKFAVRWKDPS